MKKIFISFCCVLIFYNFTLNTFASVVSSDYEIQNEFDESIVLPVVYDNTSTYAMGGTIALGSLGLTTASGGAILGAAASVVAPILAVVALVGGALVVGQGLVNIYDYVTNYALTKDEANSLGVSSTINKANGAMHLQLVKKNPTTGIPEPIKTNEPVYKKVGFPLFSKHHASVDGTIKKSSAAMISYNSNVFKLDNTYLTRATFSLIDGGYYFYKEVEGSIIIGKKVRVSNNYGSINNSLCSIGYGGYSYTPSEGWTTVGSSNHGLPTEINTGTSSEYVDLLEVLNLHGVSIIHSDIANSIINSSSLTTQHEQTEFVIDKEIIENLNPNIEFNGSDYVDKNLGTVVNPDDLIIPMPDIMTNDEIIYSPEIEEVIMPNGPTTGPLPNPNPNPDAGTGPGGDTDTETPPSEDQDKGFLESVKEFFLNLWDWLCNFWQNLLDLLMYLFNLFFGGLLDLLALIFDTVTNILNFLYELPSHFLNLFQELFVPSSDFFPLKFENILTGLTNKVPLFGQIKDFFTNLNLGGEGTPPKITITLPEFFGGETYDFIDFRFFEQYRSYYLNIVRVFMWIFAFKHIYRRLPGVISGGGYL
ncbi:hypothetical protein GMB34_14610 [Turicibacter sanguinis]|nr:hypothetical protein [Turicibacter sanguinis]MTN85350.1 hypothetical protein [Turicibacter sanguinis]MTN88221.1 hypothetical protein [Turicibacter sanguinis]MTN91097.1 hypothetical protein [Turicibacter sanguinis]MTN93948.1 hypothetical protein [Turicibacter sanguinis]